MVPVMVLAVAAVGSNIPVAAVAPVMVLAVAAVGSNIPVVVEVSQTY